ncbi:hypothetical protein DITRI_Ditri03aG0051200 [Diplodiscus trichospermus]
MGHRQTIQMPSNDAKLKKNRQKSKNGCYSKSSSLNDPELQRKKRIANYKAYNVEGKSENVFQEEL